MSTMRSPASIRNLSDREYAALFSISKSKTGSMNTAAIENAVAQRLKQKQPCVSAVEFLWNMGWIETFRDEQGNMLEGQYAITPSGESKLAREQKRRLAQATVEKKNKGANDDNSKPDPKQVPEP